MNCQNCGSELKILAGAEGFYRYCIICGAEYEIVHSKNSSKGIPAGVQV